MTKYFPAIGLCLVLAACDSFTAPRYSISADNAVALKAIGPNQIAVGDFTAQKKFDAGCRLAGPIGVPDGLTFETYIKKALADELKIAGLYDDKNPAIILSGLVNDLKFSTTSGTWDIAMTVNSSNGRSLAVSEHYDFPTSYTASSACHDAANAYAPAVQSAIGRLVAAPDFRALVQRQ